MFETLAKLPTRLMDRLRPMHPPQAVTMQAPSISEMLPYETFIDHDGWTILLLSDGSLGFVWELAPVPHEAITAALLDAQIHAVTRVLESVADPRAAFQVIWDSSPSGDFATPDYAQEPTTVAQEIMTARIDAIREKAEAPQGGLRCMRRRVYLSLRLQSTNRLGLDSPERGFLGGNAADAIHKQSEALAKTLEDMAGHLRTVEEGLTGAGLGWRRMSESAFVEIVRDSLHSYAYARDWRAHKTPFNAEVRVGSQIVLDNLEMASWGLQFGSGTDGDTMQVLSWSHQPPHVYNGMLAHLLKVAEPIRVVVNLRPCETMTDIDFKAQLLRRALDARGVRQLQEIEDTQQRITYGERLMWVSVHVFVRNVGTSLQTLREKSIGRSIANQLHHSLGLPLVAENYAAPALYFLCLPLAYGPAAGKFTVRERRVLSAAIGPFLPLFGGFPGTQSKVQLMQNRAGDPIWLSARDSETSAHVAVLASSGGGKSFWLANYLTSERAADPESLDFIIDKKTSYEVLAKVFGEECGYVLAKPPETFPNIFLGRADDDRIAIIVGILRTAISLATPSAELTAEHSYILKLAVKKTFGANYIDAATEFDGDTLVRKGATGQVVVPRLSDVVDKFTEVCRDQDFPMDIANWLRTKLSPFYGQGQYAAVFDQYCIADADPATPGVSLYDLDGVATDPILCTLTTQVVISEILRQVKRPENRGRLGRLVIEEAGVLGANSPELVLFIQDAWKTFRKLGYSCIGLTNQVDDYRGKPAPKTMWEISPTKVILRMMVDDLSKACSEDRENGVPRLIQDPHYGQLVGSLQKRDGIYSQGFWWGDEVRGTFTYAPTGYDYWLAASKPCEVETVDRLAAKIGSYRAALRLLAQHAPAGFRDRANKVRGISDTELAQILRGETQ